MDSFLETSHELIIRIGSWIFELILMFGAGVSFVVVYMRDQNKALLKENKNLHVVISQLRHDIMEMRIQITELRIREDQIEKFCPNCPIKKEPEKEV